MCVQTQVRVYINCLCKRQFECIWIYLLGKGIYLYIVSETSIKRNCVVAVSQVCNISIYKIYNRYLQTSYPITSIHFDRNSSRNQLSSHQVRNCILYKHFKFIRFCLSSYFHNKRQLILNTDRGIFFTTPVGHHAQCL